MNQNTLKSPQNRSSRPSRALEEPTRIGKDVSIGPVSLYQAVAVFTDIYSPRIIRRVNDYDIKIAHTRGEHVWHVYEHTDEFFLVLEGGFDITMRDGGGERTVSLGPGEIFVVPVGVGRHHGPRLCGVAWARPRHTGPVAHHPRKTRPRRLARLRHLG
jgi:mannose-6-phosphate isomerase-like protein (cupin superfamily)